MTLKRDLKKKTYNISLINFSGKICNFKMQNDPLGQRISVGKSQI